MPASLRLLKWGENPNRKHALVIVNDETVARLLVMQAKLGFDRVALDYEHNTIKGTQAYRESEEPRAVAAYGTPMVVPGDGLYLIDIEWTPSGLKQARNFVDLSPAVKMSETGSVVFLHSAALCRQGAVDGLHAFSTTIEIETKETDEMKDLLLTVLSLKADATDEAIEAAAKATAVVLRSIATLNLDGLALVAKLDTKTLEALTSLPANGAEMTQKLTLLETLSDGSKTVLETLSTRLAQAEGSLTVLTAGIEQRDRAALLERARREGKVVPLSAEQITKTDLVTLSTIIDKTPATVPLEARTVEGIEEYSAAPSLNSPMAGEIAERCGHTLAEVTEANK